MNSRYIVLILAAFGGVVISRGQTSAREQALPGVWRYTSGAPEKITRVTARHYPPATNGLAALPKIGMCPVAIAITRSERGCLVHAPLAPDEQIYGLGLQLQSFQQRGLKKRLRVNADPKMDTGDCNAPVPFYVTTRGYGVLIDTARYATFYLGDKKLRPRDAAEPKPGGATSDSEVLVEIPEAAGVDVYVFGGPSLREAVQ